MSKHPPRVQDSVVIAKKFEGVAGIDVPQEAGRGVPTSRRDSKTDGPQAPPGKFLGKGSVGTNARRRGGGSPSVCSNCRPSKNIRIEHIFLH